MSEPIISDRKGLDQLIVLLNEMGFLFVGLAVRCMSSNECGQKWFTANQLSCVAHLFPLAVGSAVGHG